MCNTIGILVIGLVLFLLFKNKYILGICLVIILYYYFNYKEGLTASQQKKLDATMAKLVKQKGNTVKKVNNVVVSPKKIVIKKK
jgi:hypothetical protein